jgi:hypothetical protein
LRNIIGCALLAMLWLPGLVVAQDERRAQHWTELTAFETGVIHHFRNSDSVTTAGDLLALYLLASGDVRYHDRFATLQDQVTRFVSDSISLYNIPDPRQRGDQLLRRMHTTFLTNGYDADQSALSTLLDTGVYNCISSALLYLVLAAHFDLPAAGVIMPSHAFVQLTLANGDKVEVETTSADGFDVLRDPEFFAEDAEAWFSERRLVVASYADYEQRRIISAAALGFENMWSQHISESRMPYADRVRMAEIKGMLQSDDMTAQHNRLIYYVREADFLKPRDPDLYQALMARIEPYLARWEAEAIAGLPRNGPTETLLPLLVMQAHRAQWLVQTGRSHQGQTLARQIITSAPASQPDIDVVRDTAFRAIEMTLRALQEQQQFAQLAQTLDGLETYCAQSSRCINAIEQHYSAHGQHYWDQADWHRVITLYHEYLSLDLETENTPVFQANLELAYINSFQQRWFDEERDEAIAQLETCVIRLPRATSCQEHLQATRQSLR